MARAPVAARRLHRFVPLLAIALVVALSARPRLPADRTKTRRCSGMRLHRDTDTLAQSMILRLQAISEATSALARDAASPDATRAAGLLAAAREAMVVKPEVVHIASVDAAARVTWSAASPGPLGEAVRSPNTQLTSERTRRCARTTPANAHSSFFSPAYDDRLGFGRPGQRRAVHGSRAHRSCRKIAIAAPSSQGFRCPNCCAGPSRRTSRCATASACSTMPAMRWPRRRRAKRPRDAWSMGCRSTCCRTASSLQASAFRGALAAAGQWARLGRGRTDACRPGHADRADAARRQAGQRRTHTAGRDGIPSRDGRLAGHRTGGRSTAAACCAT